MPLDDLVEQRLLGPMVLVAASGRRCSDHPGGSLRGHVQS
jgi:hypothetical protein